MTVIVWDGVTLAADKACFNGSTMQAVEKLRKISVNGKTYLLGFTGDFSVAMEMLHWAKNGFGTEHFPASNRDPKEGCSMIVVNEDREVWKYASSPYPWQTMAQRCAFGSGDNAALGALFMGATAEQAVQAASGNRKYMRHRRGRVEV